MIRGLGRIGEEDITMMQRYSSTLYELSLWIYSLVIAWVIGKVLLWPVLSFLFRWLHPERTNDMLANNIAETFFELRLALIGAICLLSLLLFVNYRIENHPTTHNTKSEKTGLRALCIVGSGYLCLYWMFQSFYWWYFSTKQIYIFYAANVLIYYNLIKFLGTILILAYEPWRLIVIKISKREGQINLTANQLFGIRCLIIGLLCLLYLWSSIPNENLGLPATLIFASLIIITFIQQYSLNFEKD